jgi:hypothetical protein
LREIDKQAGEGEYETEGETARATGGAQFLIGEVGRVREENAFLSGELEKLRVRHI